MKHLIFTTLITCLCLQGFSQQITNVTARQEGKKIVVNYDISGASSADEFEVALYCSTDGGSAFGSLVAGVSGDVGQKVKPGYSRSITWDVLADREKLQGSNIVFEVRAKKADSFGIEMVFVKGGTFTMGCTSEQSDCGSDEKPTHQVTVSDFYMGKYEVTQKQWREIMGASTSLSNPSRFSGCDDCPVESVSWNDIQEFIKKLNQKTGKKYRLPTEAEWEYAARGGSAGSPTRYSGSNNIDEVAWYWENSGDKRLSGSWDSDKISKNNCKTHPVGRKKPNELGLYDMSGNVWEWCSDWYGSDYYKNSPQNNPQGPASGSYRVLHGGSWNISAQYCRVAYRFSYEPDPRLSNNGFRLALFP
ncbi:MAG: formylglycine-generating enzyme family protein [Bacteroidales bacterium]|nr:formylglycine-generating enzyme family protein [Bacteroidales bacterium]